MTTAIHEPPDASAAPSRLLKAFIGGGLFYMLVPGTFLGVWNLLQISGRESVALVSPAWLQAHGHAQVFGWIGSFLLGIGFYSLPSIRQSRGARARAWIAWALWTGGVGLRWFATVYGWHWRIGVPASAVLECVAFGLFFAAVIQHRPAPQVGSGLPLPVRLVMTATIGFALTLVMNLAGAWLVAVRGETPAFPHAFDQRFLVLATWGCLAPFVWGFSAKWLPVLLGLPQTHGRLLAAGLAVTVAGVLLTLTGWIGTATAVLAGGAGLVIVALRLFERPVQSARTRGVHASFPTFVRIAYAWLVVGSALGVCAAKWDVSGGIWGASRHAFTVGFIATMVFAIGQRVLPAFVGARVLWSSRLMFLGLASLSTGCLLRVSSEVLAYQNYAAWAWSVLPVSALIEMAAVSIFAFNMFLTFVADDPRTATARSVEALGPAH